MSYRGQGDDFFEFTTCGHFSHAGPGSLAGLCQNRPGHFKHLVFIDNTAMVVMILCNSLILKLIRRNNYPLWLYIVYAKSISKLENMNKPVSILVVDDDQRLCDLLVRYLSREGYQVITALNGEQMRRHIEQEIPDLILLDLMLPGEDGLLLAKELRVHQGLGIIILTGKSETVDKIVGLEIGADDYISKPFDNRELLARIRSVLRRLKLDHDDPQSLSDKKPVARFAGWSLDLVAHELISPAGETVHLTSYEFKFLSVLIRNNNQLMSRDRIFDLIAGREWRPDDRSLDVLVAKLRKKLERDPANPVVIKTIRGEGYKLTVPVDFE